MNFPEPNAASSKLISFIRNEAAETVRKNAGTWLLLEYSKTRNTRTIRFMVNPQDQAMGHITRNADDTIEEHCEQKSNCSQNIFHARFWMLSELDRLLQAELLRAATLDWKPLDAATALTNPEKAQAIQQTLLNTAREIRGEAASHGIMPKGRRELNHRDLVQISNRLIRDQILNPKVKQIISHGFTRRSYTPELHNSLAENGENLPGLATYLAENPKLFHLAVKLTSQDFFRKASPEDINQAMIGEIGIAPDLWPLAKTLATAKHSDWEHNADANAIRIAVQTAHQLPDGPNTGPVQLELARHLYHLPKIQNLPGETLQEWHTLLNFLCSQPDLTQDQIQAVIDKTCWKLTTSDRDSSSWKAPTTTEELTAAYELQPKRETSP